MDIILKAFQLMESQQSESALKLLKEKLLFADGAQKFAISEFYLQWGFYDKATAVLENLLQKYPEESELKVMLANIYIEIENDKEAVHLLNEIKKNDPAYEQSL